MDTNPFDPNKTKIPDFGISKLKSSIATTLCFFQLHQEDENVLFRLRIEMAVPGGTGETEFVVIFGVCTDVRFQNDNHGFRTFFTFGSRASYNCRSKTTVRYGQRKTSI